MLVQSGKPVGVMRTHEWAPRVLIANSNLVGDWANWEEFRRLEDLGLTMYGQMTAGSWIYIGTQGILQGTFETFAAVADKRVRRHARRHHHADRRPRRHGRRAAARGHHERRRRDLHRRRPVADQPPDRAPLPRRAGRLARPRRRARRRGPRRPEAPLHRRARQRRRAVPDAARAGRADRHRHRPDLRARPAVLPAARHRLRRLARRGAPRPRRLHQGRAGVDGRARAGDGGVPGQGRRGLRLRQLDPRRGPQGRLRPGVRVPGLRAGLHPAAVLRGQGPVPLGGALRRPGRHRRDRPGDPRAVPRQRAAAQVDHDGRRAGARSRACPRGSAGSGTASATSPA